MIEFEVDISGKIMVETDQVALALAGSDFSYAVHLCVAEKQKALEVITQIEVERTKAINENRKKGNKKAKVGAKRGKADIGKRLYGIMLYYLLSRCPDLVENVVLDEDYDKKSLGSIKTAVKRVLKREGVGPSHLSITTRKLGDGMADRLSKQVNRGARKADWELTAEDLLYFYTDSKKPSFWPG